MGEKGNITDNVSPSLAEDSVAQQLSSAQQQMTGMHHTSEQATKLTGAVAPLLGDDDSSGPAAVS